MMLAALALAAAMAEPAAPPTSPKSQIYLRYECRNDLGRREITLFGNGTIRLREGLNEDPAMFLAESTPEELEAFLNRLRAEDLSEVPLETNGSIEGAWVETCRFELTLPDAPARTYRFGRYDSLPLALSRLLRVAEDMAAKIDPSAREEHLPAGYEPRPGDILRRVDGELNLSSVLPRFARYADYRFQIGEALTEPYHEAIAATTTNDAGVAELSLDLKRFIGRAYRLDVLGRAYEAEGGRNVAAQRLYQRCGFVTRRVQLQYHKSYD